MTRTHAGFLTLLLVAAIGCGSGDGVQSDSGSVVEMLWGPELVELHLWDGSDWVEDGREEFAYDSNRRLLTLLGGIATYDAAGRLVEVALEGGGHIMLERDWADNISLVRWTDAEGSAVRLEQHFHDGARRLSATLRMRPVDEGWLIVERVRYEYDSRGRLLNEVLDVPDSAAGSWRRIQCAHYDYDMAGRILSKTVHHRDAARHEFEYDEHGLVATLYELEPYGPYEYVPRALEVFEYEDGRLLRRTRYPHTLEGWSSDPDLRLEYTHTEAGGNASWFELPEPIVQAMIDHYGDGRANRYAYPLAP